MEMSEKEFLTNYKNVEKDKYEKASNTVDNVVITFGESNLFEVLMIKRKGHPYKGSWALSGGFMDMGETLEESAKRELQEETGITEVFVEQLGVYSTVNRDERMRVISTGFMALVDKEQINPIAQDDAEEVGWFTVDIKEVKNNNITSVQLTLSKDGEDFISKFNIVTSENIFNPEKEYVILESALAFDHVLILYKAFSLLADKSYKDITYLNLFPNKVDLATFKQSIYQLQEWFGYVTPLVSNNNLYNFITTMAKKFNSDFIHKDIFNT